MFQAQSAILMAPSTIATRLKSAKWSPEWLGQRRAWRLSKSPTCCVFSRYHR